MAYRVGRRSLELRCEMLSVWLVLLLCGCTYAPSSPGVTTTSPGVTTTRLRGFHVTDIVARADPFSGSVPCPVTITFSARIKVSGGGTVRYRWRSSNDTVTPIGTLKFNGAGSQNIRTTWTLGAPKQKLVGWAVVEILSPASQRSEQAGFSLACL